MSPEREDALALRLAAALCLVSLLLWALQFQPFELPNNDYDSFERTALALGQGELPRRATRMPILPGLMALLAPLVPEPHAHLRAALVLNLAFAVALLGVLARYAIGSLGAGGLLFVAVFAGTAQLHAAALQPLVEPSLACFVALAFEGLRRRSGWQYVAAAAAALSRIEAATLIGVLFLVNAVADRRIAHHAVRAALAGLPLLVWLGLGRLGGSSSSGSFYLALMGDMGFRPAFHFFVTSWKEPFRGWFDFDSALSTSGFLLAVVPALGVGLASELRRAPRDACALALFWTVSVVGIVAFGIDKGRYVFPTSWILLYFWSAGVLVLLARAARQVAARSPWAVAGLGLLLLGLVSALAQRWIVKRLAIPEPLALDALYAAILLALVGLSAFAIARRARARGPSLAIPILLALVLCVPLLGAGLRSKARDLEKYRWGNHGIVLAAEWIGHEFTPDDRAVVLHNKHYRFLTGLPEDRFLAFHKLEAGRVDEMAEEMRARGFRYVIATWRKPVSQASDAMYEERFKWGLTDPFLRREDVPGFEHVAELPLPAHLGRPPVQIYRVATP